MVRSLGGDGAAYAVLLGKLNGFLRAYYRRRLGNAADAEDLLQETLIAMHTRRATYDPTRPLTAWVHAIARYKLIDHFRRTKRRAEDPLDDPDMLFSSQDTTAADALNSTLAATLAALSTLSALATRTRTAVPFRAFHLRTSARSKVSRRKPPAHTRMSSCAWKLVP